MMHVTCLVSHSSLAILVVLEFALCAPGM
jgi:hypothetical protein